MEHGKNYYINELAQDKENHILMITTRNMIRDSQIFNSEKNAKTQLNYNDDNSVNIDNKLDCMQERFTSNIDEANNMNLVITHQALTKYLKTKDINIFDRFCFTHIVFDEIHCLFSESEFADSTFHLLTFLKRYLNKVTLIAMTGTGEILENYFKNMNFKVINAFEECYNRKPKMVTQISNQMAIDILKQTNSNNKMIYMANSAKNIINTLIPKLINANENLKEENISIIMNPTKAKKLLKKLKVDDKLYNTKKKYLEKTMLYNENESLTRTEVEKCIVENEKLQDEVNILLATSRCKEGISLSAKSELDKNIKAIFCESAYSIDIIQFAGRVRYDVENLYIIADAEKHKAEISPKNARYEFDYCMNSELTTCNQKLEKILDIANKLDKYKDKINDVNYNYLEIPLVIDFVRFIEGKFNFIKYNILERRFNLFDIKKEAIIIKENDNNKFIKNPQEYLSEVMKSESVNIKFMTKSQKDEELKRIGKKTDRENVLDYFLNKNSPIRTEELYEYYICSDNKMNEFPNYIDFKSNSTRKFLLNDIAERFNIKTKRGTSYVNFIRLLSDLKIDYEYVGNPKKGMAPIIILENGVDRYNYIKYCENVKKEFPESHEKMLNFN